MIIDFHTHVFPDRIAASAIERLEKAINTTASTDGTLTGLLSSMFLMECGILPVLFGRGRTELQLPVKAASSIPMML